MSPLEAAFYVAGILGALGLVPTVIWVGKRVTRANRADTESVTRKTIDAALQPFDARMGRIEQQFGPNGGGLREAVNNVGADVRVVKANVSGLTRRFEDHLVQSHEDRNRLADVERSLRSRQH